MSQHAAKLEHIRSLIHDKPEQARAMCQRLVQSAPRDPWTHATMARVLLRMGSTQQALHFAQRAAELAPADPNLLMSHAEFLGYENQPQKAEQVLRRALALDPSHMGCLHHLALTLQRLERPGEAEALCREGLRRDPNNQGLQSILAGVLLNLGRIEDSVALTRAASESNPDNPLLASGLALMLNYLPGATPQGSLAAHTRYANLLDRTDPAPPRTFTNTKDPSRRICVGIVSPDLRQHSVAYFIEPWLEHHSESIALVVYQTNRIADAVTARLKSLIKPGNWRVMDNISDAALAEKIFADRIDILVELSGHTHAHSLPALHRRPAPIQATYLGYPNTTGLKEVDYRIVDSITDPPPADQYVTERLLRLDPCFLCYKPPADAPPIERRRPKIENDVTFCSFNALQKLNQHLVAFWSRLLNSIPNSRLLLKGGSPANTDLRTSITQRFAQAGLDPSRITFLPSAPTTAEHLALYNQADIALDPFPYNGTTTTCEALFMGVPVIALAGTMHSGRVGASLLNAVGLKDLIAESESDFISIAQRLASNESRRTQLRENLRAVLLSSPLCDARAFSKRMDHALRSIWQTWCSSP
jgi:predicted O-linked N-acetylglucosamine transferase (SPINDLY family)